MHDSLGIVAIGRNEGERLCACFESLVVNAPPAVPVVYVDSGSTDGSVALAEAHGAAVVNLDLVRPFTAARARNEGVERLLSLHPTLEFIFFLDGDCRLAPGFLDAAVRFLREHPDYAVVCGRRREIDPGRNLYHRLADMEWDTPTGDALACGGDALVRRAAFDEVGGFNPALIAGEEPELCLRLRNAKYKIRRIDHDMTLHDVDMKRFGQWWKRAARGGFAYALVVATHRNATLRVWMREAFRTWFWAVVLPVAAIVLASTLHWGFLLMLLLYLVPFSRAMSFRLTKGATRSDATLYAASCILAKFAELTGQCRFYYMQSMGRQHRIMEYK